MYKKQNQKVNNNGRMLLVVEPVGEFRVWCRIMFKKDKLKI